MGTGVVACVIVEKVLLFAESTGVVGDEEVGEGEVVELTVVLGGSHGEGGAVVFQQHAEMRFAFHYKIGDACHKNSCFCIDKSR